MIDTSDLNVHELRRKVDARVRRRARHVALRATVLSFGFKYGMPVDADIVARRALPAQPALGARAARR